MDGGAYIIVFDLAASGYKAWTFPAIGLILLAVGLALSWFPGLFAHWPWTPAGIRVFGQLFAGFAAVWTAVSFWATYSLYLDLADQLVKGRYEVVEGPVEDYKRSETEESFSVRGVVFSYSSSAPTSAFNHTAAEGGPVRPGLYVRITHVDGKILRLEIRR
jgi:hypothetical protein